MDEESSKLVGIRPGSLFGKSNAFWEESWVRFQVWLRFFHANTFTYIKLMHLKSRVTVQLAVHCRPPRLPPQPWWRRQAAPPGLLQPVVEGEQFPHLTSTSRRSTTWPDMFWRTWTRFRPSTRTEESASNSPCAGTTDIPGTCVERLRYGCLYGG